MANPVFGMMQSLDGYVDVIKAEVQGDIASFIEASPATYVPGDRSTRWSSSGCSCGRRHADAREDLFPPLIAGWLTLRNARSVRSD
jgi:hypothetical protein